MTTKIAPETADPTGISVSIFFMDILSAKRYTCVVKS
jgi:hypothetical protein